MTSLSSLSNCGISGVSATERGTVPVCGLASRAAPGFGGPFVEFVENGAIHAETYVPSTEGEVVFFFPLFPSSIAIPFIAVEIDEQLEWIPALIYHQLINSSTGQSALEY